MTLGINRHYSYYCTDYDIMVIILVYTTYKILQERVNGINFRNSGRYNL